jgi:DNA polymerase III subunit epsilon
MWHDLSPRPLGRGLGRGGSQPFQNFLRENHMPNRQIVLDTETTGLGPGHKIIEIGCLVLENRKLTNTRFHTYLNPEREIDPGAFKVHGLGLDFLQDKPLFKTIMPDFLEFIAGAELIIHNAPFDVGFLNAELKQAKCPKALTDYCTVLDNLVLAREKHPGQKNNLDALCKRYSINNSNRQLHGALLDAELLAKVYLAMTREQIDLFDTGDSAASIAGITEHSVVAMAESEAFRVIYANEDELSAHEALMGQLKRKC